MRVHQDIFTSETNNFLKINEETRVIMVSKYLRIFNHGKIFSHSTLLSFSFFLYSAEFISSSPTENTRGMSQYYPPLFTETEAGK